MRRRSSIASVSALRPSPAYSPSRSSRSSNTSACSWPSSARSLARRMNPSMTSVARKVAPNSSAISIDAVENGLKRMPSRTSGGLAEAVAGAANGVEQRLGEALVDLLAQAADVNVDHVGPGIEMVVPHALEQHGARNDLFG